MATANAKGAIKKVEKRVRPSGVTAGVVTFQPSKEKIVDKLGKGGAFILKKWIRRINDFNGVSHAERLGMIRSIPHLGLRDAKEWWAIARRVLMPLVDGLAEDSGRGREAFFSSWTDSAAMPNKLRIEAWFVLAEFFFSANVCRKDLVACEGYVSDMLTFFRKNTEGYSPSNFDVLALVRPLESCFADPERRCDQTRKNKELSERVTKAHRGMLEHLRYFFMGVWDFQKLIAGTSFDRTKGADIHQEISVERRFEIFLALINIEPKWLKDLPWDGPTFDLVVQYMVDENVAPSLLGLAKCNVQGESHLRIAFIKSARVLVQVAWDKGWSSRRRVED